MGWSHSVYIGQAIHEAIVVRAGLGLEDSFQRTKEIAVGEWRTESILMTSSR
jgi:hypothetical protein